MTKKELLNLSKEIRDVISEKQKEMNLSFVEDTHTYFIKDKDGNMRTDFPSVSTVIKQFYDDFPALEKSLDMCNGDIFEQDKLLKEWRGTADYANSKGSRVHYLLEKDLLDQYGAYKDVRMPIFDCDDKQTSDGNAMISAGHDFIRLMQRRGAVLLDTEMVLGSNTLEYTGQPDKVWLMTNKDGEPGIVITDWKGLPLDTPILTNNGWKTMGTLTLSDKVYDKDGNQVLIKNISSIKNKRCFKITFDDGLEIVSDFEHRWLINQIIKDDVMDVTIEKVLTTKAIFDKFSDNTFTIPTQLPLINEEDKISLDPYICGFYVANDLSLKTEDVDVKKMLIERGLTKQKEGEFGKIRLPNLISSRIKFRRLCLSGILDTLASYDYISSNYVIKSTNMMKLEIIKEVSNSLGLKTKLNKMMSNSNTAYTLTINENKNLFLLKEVKMNENFIIDRFRTVVNVEEVDSIPTKCIEVNSSTSTFLCTKELLVTHNTNKVKNFKVHSYTKPMLKPFEDEMDTALGHYKIQLPLYGRLLLDMLKGTKFDKMKLFGCVIVHLTDTSVFTEFRVPSDFINTVMTMDPLPRIDEILKKKKQDIIDEENRVKILKENMGG